MFGDHICEVHYIRAFAFAEFTLGSLPLDGGGEEPDFLSSVLFEAVLYYDTKYQAFKKSILVSKKWIFFLSNRKC